MLLTRLRSDVSSEDAATGPGRYVTNDPRGARAYPYSRSQTVNPLTYGSLKSLPAEKYAIGEVWANMLHNVMAGLVDAYGWSNVALLKASGGHGNVVFMRLLIDSLKIQPCNPTFLNARDAIIDADACHSDLQAAASAARCLQMVF